MFDFPFRFFYCFFFILFLFSLLSIVLHRMEYLDGRPLSVLGLASGYFRGRTQLPSLPRKSVEY